MPTPPSQQSSTQRCHCAHRLVTIWGFSSRVSSSWARFTLVPKCALPSHCDLSVFAIQTGICLGFRGGWRVRVLPIGCRDPGLSVPVLQGGSTSEQGSEKENLSYERRFLGSAFRSFCSGCLDALLPALINVSGGKLPPVPHSLSKEGRETVQDICPHFLILTFSINSPGSPAPKPAGRKI